MLPDTILVRGNGRLSDETVLMGAGLRPRVQLNFPMVQRAIRDLVSTYEYDAVDIQCGVGADGSAAIVITVQERALLADLKVEGPRQIPRHEVESRIDLLLGRPADPSKVALAIRRIDSLYKSKQFYLARITPDTTIIGDRIGITFHVDEGRRLAISGLRITGASAVSAAEIADAMKTRPEGFLWWHNGEFDEDKYATDVGERIPALYAERGYADFQIERDTMTVDAARGKALIELDLREGPQYRVSGFEVVGNRRFTAEQIGTLYPFQDRDPTLGERASALIKRRQPATDVFDRRRWDDATQQLRTLYNNDGYIYAQINPVVEKDPTDSAARVRLRWDIREGSPALINRVEILGNDFTVESCIRDQLFIIPGDVFNQDRLVRSWQGINNLGFFESPLPFPDTRQANENGDIDIVFRVKEKRTGQVNFGASAGQGTGLGGFISLDQPNLFGKCKRGQVSWQFGKYINDFSASYTDPGIRGSRVSGQLTAYHSMARYRVGDLGQMTRIGANMRVGFPFPESRFTRVFTTYGYETVKFGDYGLVGETVSTSCVGCQRSMVGLDITRDTRVDMPFATEGTLHTFSAQFNGGFLGGSAEFQRYTGEMRSYTLLGSFGGKKPGTQARRLTLGVSARGGSVFGDVGNFFWSQSFAMGGVQYGEPLRGYPEFSITPGGYLSGTGSSSAQRQSFGNAYFSTTAEIGLRFNNSFYANAFFDAGNVWNRARDIDPTRLYRGLGVGVSTISPLGPLGIDYALGLDRRDASGRLAPKWQLHFKLGQFF